MPSEQFEEARRRLDLLESTWISLLLWMGQLKGISPEEMVLSIPEKGAELIGNYERRRSQFPTAAFGPLHFVQFPDYLTIAKRYRAELQSLGNPAQSWVRDLERSFQECTPFRNDLQHAARFDHLPPVARNTALGAFDSQIRSLLAWWPDHQPTEQTPVREENPLVLALQVLNRDQTSAVALAEELGFKPIRNPVNLIPTGADTPLARDLGEGIGRLYRVGEKNVGGPTVGVYLAYLDQWPERSAQRERYRRRLARALTVHQTAVDPRFLIILADNSAEPRREIEIVYPRQREGATASTVRATMELDDPTRYHRDLLRELSLANVTSLKEVIRRWNVAFNVEKVTESFFKEFQGLRNGIAEALITSNPNNPALEGRSLADFRVGFRNATNEQRQFQLNVTAFATRQLSRMLFLWFLQAKGWLGSEIVGTSRTFLIDLFRQRPRSGDTYFADVLVPLYFDALGERANSDEHKNAEAMLTGLLKNADAVYLPYVDGGLFRADADAFERDLFGVDNDGKRTRKVVLPDELFDPARDDANPGRHRQRTVLGLLRSYRFTTQESTPDDQSVDPDPELLGKVFEDLYQADERHETGAYYTPREIVRYMCREALDGYLRDTTAVEQATLDRIRNEAIDFASEDLHLTPAEESALTEALEDVTVVDPAVGSGAFLVGMLQEIVQLRRGIQAAATDRDVDRTSKDVYEWKRRAITHSLHGVDINPTAVEICRLRLWLSLVIEYDVKWLRDIPALPNLEFRVVAGDSLVDRMGEYRFVHSLPLDVVQIDFEVEQKYRQIADHHRQFNEADERARSTRLRGLQETIRFEIAEICRLQSKAVLLKAKFELATLGTNRRPSQQAIRRAQEKVASLEALDAGLDPNSAFLKPLLWPLVFPHVFSDGRTGFDIVVANPPYVRQESLPESDQGTYYQHAFPEVYNGTADLYVFFFARALQLLREGGGLAFITSNMYMTSGYGEALRTCLSSSVQISSILDFGVLPIFDAGVCASIMVGRKNAAPDETMLVTAADVSSSVRMAMVSTGANPASSENLKAELRDLERFIQLSRAGELRQNQFGPKAWRLENRTIVELFNRLANLGASLRTLTNGQMNNGIKTGFNKAFVIDQPTRDALVAQDAKSVELLRPWLRGRDIKYWKPQWQGQYLVSIQNSGDSDSTNPWRFETSESDARVVFRSSYPAIHEHLSEYENELRKRSDQGRFWWELRPCAYFEQFSQPKIMWPEIVAQPKFAMDVNGSLANNKVFFCVGLGEAELALMNSSVGEFLVRMTCPILDSGSVQMMLQYLWNFPIPEISQQQRVELSDSARLHLQGEESNLDDLAATIYGLKANDLQLMQQWLATKRPSGQELVQQVED